MARYLLIISNRADKFIKKLNEKRLLRVIQEMNDLENFPFFTAPHDLAKLKGRKGYYRIRIGDLRIIFKVNKEQRKIYIEKIGYRKKIYT